MRRDYDGLASNQLDRNIENEYHLNQYTAKESA